MSQCGTEVDRLLQDAENRIATALNQLAGAGSRLATSHKQQEMEFRSLIEKHQQAQGQAAERAQLERRRNDLLAKNRQRQQLADQLATLDANRKTLLERLSELWDERFAVREGVAERINAHLTPVHSGEHLAVRQSGTLPEAAGGRAQRSTDQARDRGSEAGQRVLAGGSGRRPAPPRRRGADREGRN